MIPRLSAPAKLNPAAAIRAPPTSSSANLLYMTRTPSASNLPFGSSVIVIVSVTGSPDPRQRPFGPRQLPVSGQLSRDDWRRASLHVPASCSLSAVGVCLSGHPVPARGLGLPYGRLTGHLLVPGPGRGYHVPRLRDTTGLGALSTPGTAVLALAGCRARPSPAASQRPVPAPRNRSHQRGSSLRGINEGSRDSPVRPAPHLWFPGWDGNPLGFPLCSAPRRYQRRTTGRGRA
jgi:hypothetical protein